MTAQDDSWNRRGILQSLQKLGAEVSSLNRQKQQLLHELKSLFPSEPSVIVPEGFSLNEKVRIFKDLFRG